MEPTTTTKLTKKITVIADAAVNGATKRKPEEAAASVVAKRKIEEATAKLKKSTVDTKKSTPTMEDDDDDILNEEALTKKLDEYTEELNDASNIDVVSELEAYEHIHHGLYEPRGKKLIPMPTDKYNSYGKFVKMFGFRYSNDNRFLLNNGILDVLQVGQPSFCFWEHGLDIYLPKVDMFDDKSKNLVFKTSKCTTHPFKCSPSEPCEIVETCEPGSTLKYFFSGTFRALQNPKFTSYYIELDNCARIESPSINIASSLTLHGANISINVLERCKHDGCGVGDFESPFPDMAAIRKLCPRIDVISAMSDTYAGKRCFAYGRGINGNFHKQSSTLFLNTWHLSDLYIVNF